MQSRTQEHGMVDVACALCGSAKHDAHYPLTRGAIVCCATCGFFFVSPRLHSEALLSKLQQWASQDVVDRERLRIAFDAQTIALYRGYLARISSSSAPGQLLDVGCSTGALLSVARDAGWQTYGVEIGHASANYARGVLGLSVTEGSLYSFNPPPASFDAIVFLEVIEHLEDPVGALKRIVSWLKPGGALLISTPNYDSLYRRCFGTDWWVVNCEDEHIQFFTAASLRRILEEAQLSITWQQIRGVDWAGMWSTWRTWRKCRGQKERLASRVPQTPVPAADVDGYHDARSRKEAIKATLATLGLLRFSRALLAKFDLLCSIPHLPTYAWGEQLIMIAVKK